VTVQAENALTDAASTPQRRPESGCPGHVAKLLAQGERTLLVQRRRPGGAAPAARSAASLSRLPLPVHAPSHHAGYVSGGEVMGKLEGKVALVTGSGRNIGRATILKLAAEGAHVVVNARTNRDEAEAVVREARALGVKALAIIADIARTDQVEAMAAEVLSAFGRIDILINNAAVRPHKPFTELTPQDWEAVRGVVLDGPLFLTRAAIGSMVQNRYGRILFFTGEGAFIGGSGRAHVSAAKMGLVGFARGLASEFAPHNIRVNVVSPGSIDTIRANPEWYQGRTPSAAGIPLGRQGTVEEIAATCLFLVSDDGGFITGQTIHVNGGSAYY
jgi:3-oxoacyl-[acyl-carrier protein] reductase